jgi:hypothetical protein
MCRTKYARKVDLILVDYFIETTRLSQAETGVVMMFSETKVEGDARQSLNKF